MEPHTATHREDPIRGMAPRGRQSSRIRSFPRWVWVEGQAGGGWERPLAGGRRSYAELSWDPLRSFDSVTKQQLLPPLSFTGQAFRAPSTESRGLEATSAVCSRGFLG